MTHGIYPPELATELEKRAGQKYRPSNGTEGAVFMEAWCCRCQRDRSMREGEPVDECDDNELCPIIGDTMAYSTEDPGYPVEWQYGKDGQPCCTAFIPAGDPVPPTRCEHTADMFGGAS